MINTLLELQHLATLRPSATASAADIAAWYPAKCDLHEHLATEAHDASAAARNRELARRAGAGRVAGADIPGPGVACLGTSGRAATATLCRGGDSRSPHNFLPCFLW
ncbi:hypothetical protein [Amycolatopsis sp.]|uniref:hypothetical protein n=1 Tax=Amycolatopsis sp. TaxID=37632 RepID=UPI002CF53ACA|nr:hypothetical protein [Amycolatopsis sp.]HVV12043.1 hypothetical protein [Amycolatopsis sp.]